MSCWGLCETVFGRIVVVDDCKGDLACCAPIIILEIGSSFLHCIWVMVSNHVTVFSLYSFQLTSFNRAYRKVSNTRYLGEDHA